MGNIQAIYKVTNQLNDHLRQPLPFESAAREEYLDLIDFLLEKRGFMMASLKSPTPPPVESSTAKEIAEKNEAIEKKLGMIKAQIGRDLNQTRSRLRVENQYANAFASPTLEGIYFDKKN